MAWAGRAWFDPGTGLSLLGGVGWPRVPSTAHNRNVALPDGFFEVVGELFSRKVNPFSSLQDDLHF
jgi:hypothetical protein